MKEEQSHQNIDSSKILRTKTSILGTIPLKSQKEETQSNGDLPSIPETISFDRTSSDETVSQVSSDGSINQTSKIQSYFDHFIVIFLILNSFFSYSYLNIIHLLYAFFLMNSFDGIYYNFYYRNKYLFAIIVLIIDIFYLLLKFIFHIIYITAGNEEKNENFFDIQKGIFVIFDNWRIVYDYTYTFLVIIILLLYILIKDFSFRYFDNHLRLENFIYLDRKIKNNRYILNLGIFIICISASISPTIVNITLLFFGLLFFYGLLLSKEISDFFTRKFKNLFLIIITIYTLYNYIINSWSLLNKISPLCEENEGCKRKTNPFFGLIIIFDAIYEKDQSLINKTDSNSDIILQSKSWNFIGILPFLLFYISFYCINFHNKCLELISYSQNDNDNQDLYEAGFGFYSSPSERLFSNETTQKDNEETIIDVRRMSSSGSFSISKEKTKIQTLFDTDIDCGIIVFLKEYEEENILNKIKLFLIKFCYTPGFCLHACRLGAIFWINFYKIYYESYFLILWLLLSIKYSTSSLFLYGTLFIIYPLLVIVFFLTYVANFYKKVLVFNEDQTGLKKAINMCSKIIIISFFQLFVHLKLKYSKNLKDFEINSSIKKQQNNIKLTIDSEFKGGKYVLKPLEIFFKLYFLLLDVAVIIFFYLSISQTINILNELILLCIVALLLFGKKFMPYLYAVLLVLTFFFMVKYFLYFYYSNDNVNRTKTRLFLSLLFNDNLYNIHYYWISYYLLFLEYIGQTSQLFKICKDKSFSMFEIIEYNFGSFIYIKFILNTLFNFIFGIYIWLLIPCFIYCLLLHDNNCFALIQLLIVFVIYYKYIKIVGVKFKNLYGIFSFTRALIITNVLYLITIYVIQFLNKAPISILYQLDTVQTKKVLELTGLFLFNGEYTSNLSCFFIMFILSVLLHAEISRQIKINVKDSTLKRELEKERNSIFNKIDTNILGESNVKDEKSTKKRTEDNEKTIYIIKKIFNVLYYILHYYWIIIFIFVAYLSLNWMLSVSMIIQLSIFCYYIGRSFLGYYECLKDKKKSEEKQRIKLEDKMKKYIIEKSKHFTITSDTQHKYFNLIWIFTFSFIIASYLCSIVLKYLEGSIMSSGENESNNNYNIPDKIKYISALMYLLGLYSVSNSNSDSKITNFWSYTWGYFIIIGLFSIRAYFLSKFAEIKVLYFSDEKTENLRKRAKSKTNRKLSGLELYVKRIEGADANNKDLKPFEQLPTFQLLPDEKTSINKKNVNKKSVSRTSRVLEYFEMENVQKMKGKLTKNQIYKLDDEEAADLSDLSFEAGVFENINLDNLEDKKNKVIECYSDIENDNNDKDKEEKDLFNFGRTRKERKLISKSFKKRREFEKEKNEKIKEKLFGKEYNGYYKQKKKIKEYKDDFYIEYKQAIININLQKKITVQIGIKKFMELIIVTVMLLSALFKCNVLTFVFLIILISTYNQKYITTHLMFKISFCVLFLLILQYIIFVSNVSYITNPFTNNEVIVYVKEIIGIPWYNNYRWSTFYSLGTNPYQILTLWFDVALVLILYFYLEFYSFTIYEEEDRTNEIQIMGNLYNDKFKSLKTMTHSEYNSFVRAMKVSYNIELKTRDKNKKIYGEILTNTNGFGKKIYNRTFLKIAYIFKKDKRYINVLSTKKTSSFVKAATFFYLCFHYLFLFSTLMISSFNQGLIGLGYMSFSIYYIYKSHCFLKGRRWSLLNGIRYFMKPYLFFDIVSQFVFQIPLSKYNKNNETLTYFFNLLGYVEIADYSSNRKFLHNSFWFVLLKILSYFLLLIQEKLYTSYGFKKFILKYHYEYLQKAYIKGKLHSFLFNNYRVKMMNDRLNERKQLNQSLLNIQNTVNKWNIKVTSYSNDENNLVPEGEGEREGVNTANQKTQYELPNTPSSLGKKDKGITVAKIIRKQWLISLALNIIQSARKVDDEHFNIAGDIIKILRGDIVLYSYLNNLINDFEKKNYKKYCDIRNLNNIREEKEKKKKKENNGKDINKNEYNEFLYEKDEDNDNNNINNGGDYKFRRKRTVAIKTPSKKLKQFNLASNNNYNHSKSRDKEKDKDKENILEHSEKKENINLISNKNEEEYDNNNNNNGNQKEDIDLSLNKNSSSSSSFTRKEFRQSANASMFSEKDRNKKRNTISEIIFEQNFLGNKHKNNQQCQKEEDDFDYYNKKLKEKEKEDPSKLTEEEKASKTNKEKYIRLDQPYDDMFFSDADYRDLKWEIRTDFFNHYCSRRKIFLIIIKGLINFFSENFEYIVYFVLLLNHLVSGNVVSLVYAIFVFLFGIIQYPRPARIFWKILLIYTAFIIFLKFLIQLNVWENFDKFKIVVDYIELNPTSFVSFLGIKKIYEHNIILFFWYVTPDFCVLIILIINQFMLIRKGLWYFSEAEYETIEDSYDRIIQYTSQKYCKEHNFDVNDRRIMNSNEIMSLVGEIKTVNKKNILKRFEDFYKINFTRKRNEKPGKDFYMYYTSLQVFILIYIIFFYTKMEQDKMVYNVDTFKLKQFSGNMVIFAFIHVFLLVFDRFLYLKNARNLQKITFKVYDKINGKDITYKYRNDKYEGVLKKVENNPRYEVVPFQYEECQVGLLLKYATQICMVIFIHLFIYFYLPSLTASNQEDIKHNDNKITTNIFILLFYLLYIFYFIFSGLQVKYGLPDLKKVSSLMKHSNLFYNYVYKSYKNIPFLFELKNFIDWTFTSTSLDLWKWLKLEEIISLLFINKCVAKSYQKRRVGSKSPIYMKIFLGGATFFGMIFLIIGPLVLFSSLNPINSVNPVRGIDLKVILAIPNENNQKLNLTLFETSNSIITDFKSDKDYEDFMRSIDNIELNNFNKSFKFEQVQRVQTFYFSMNNWDISTKFIDYLKKNNRTDNYDIIIKYFFYTEHGASSENNYNFEMISNIDQKYIKQFIHILTHDEIEKSLLRIKLEDFYSPFQRVQSEYKPVPLITKKNTVYLELEKKVNKNSDVFIYNWALKDINNKGIEFVTFSDYYSIVTFGYDVLTFYVSFIYLAGTLIRGFFLGQAERIMYIEMVNPNRLFSLCEGIKISRIRKDHLQEEKLYYLLIDLMRSPEIIKNMTQSSLIFIQDNNTVKKEIKNKEFEIPSFPAKKKKY